MKELINTMVQDIRKEGYTRTQYILYGIVFPLALVAICILAELLEPSI